MSDYLRRLAERAIGVAQSIKPRAPYRFEAVADSLLEIPHEPPDEVARMDDAERAPDTAAQDPLSGRANMLRPTTRSSERSSVDVSPLPRTTNVTTAPTGPDKRAMGPAKFSAVTTPSSAAIENTKPNAPYRPPRRNDTSMSSAAARNEHTARLHIARTRNESPSPLPEKPAATHAPDARGASTIGSERLASRALVAGGSSASGPKETRPIVRAKEITRKAAADRRDVRRAVDELFSDRKPGGHQEPTVAVTIGRVEVRAVMEPPKAPPRTRRAATNGISLDDYLTRHEEKRR